MILQVLYKGLKNKRYGVKYKNIRAFLKGFNDYSENLLNRIKYIRYIVTLSVLSLSNNVLPYNTVCDKEEFFHPSNLQSLLSKALIFPH